MSSAVNHFSIHISTLAIKEDSILLKAISCIPVVGVVFSLFQETSIADKITQTSDPTRAIELINLKNQYKIANVVRNLFTAALIATGIALGILSGSFAFGAVLISAHVGMAGINICQIHQNNQVVNELQTTGFRMGMQVK